jgi:beta-lactamase regulating signal transducer with metallopeptidase domain
MSFAHALLEPLAFAGIRAALLVGGTLATMPLLRRSSAATRRAVLVLALGGAAALPALSAIAPAWRIHTPAPLAALAIRGIVVTEPLADASISAGSSSKNEANTTTSATSFSPSFSSVSRPRWSTLLLSGWAFGALFVLTRLAVGLHQTRGLRRRARPTDTWDQARTLAESQTGRRVPVSVTDELDAPAVVGVWNPQVLVPRASADWSVDRQVPVLLHELAHVRRHDCLAHVVAEIACALHWFNPLVWLAARRLRLERELAADDAVLLAGATPSSYADDLLRIAGALDRPSPSGTLGMAERSQLATRVVAIVSKGHPRMPLNRPKFALLVTSFAGGVLALACTTPKSAESPSPALVGPSTSTTTPKATDTQTASTASSDASATAIDPRLQAIADEELDRVMQEWQGAAGTVLLLDPSTGEIVANAGRDHGKPADVAADHVYVTGSTFKAVTLAGALEDKVLAANERLDCEQGKRAYGSRIFEDYRPFGVLTVPEALAVSSNIAFSKVFDKLGGKRLDHWVRAFHFGESPKLAGGKAAAGVVPGPFADHSFEGAVAAIGEAVTASPLQVAAAYAVLANDGVYVAPTRDRRTSPAPRETLLRPETAQAVVRMLEGAVNSEMATGSSARLVEGPRVAGKTGTAAWENPSAAGGKGIYASFVGLVPATKARWVILVGVEQPRDGAAGGKVAAPVFARVAKRALALPAR